MNLTRYGVTPDGQKFLIHTRGTEATTVPAVFFTVIANWQRDLK
jgi:hypothetical protein